MVAMDREAMSEAGRFPRFIYLTGCDGSGKSTHARHLLAYLKQRNIRTRLVWLRFPFLFSIPLLIYARLNRYSWYETNGDFRHGYWDFRRSWVLQHLLPWTLLCDAILAAIFHIYLPMFFGTTILCERFVLDMLVDLAVAGAVSFSPLKPPVSLYPKLIPPKGVVMILTLDAESIRERRADLKSDHYLEKRLKAFEQLARIVGYPLISTQPPIHAVAQQIIITIGRAL